MIPTREGTIRDPRARGALAGSAGLPPRLLAPGLLALMLGAMLGVMLGVMLGAGAAHAEPGSRDSPATRDLHVNMGAGGFVAFTGPASHGPAAELELYPGGALGRWGAGVYWRGFGGFAGGMVAAGPAFEAGASRPMFVLAMHGEIGWDYGSSLPVIGGGVRAQLAPWHPLSLASNVTGHLFLDGVDTRLALALTLTLGLTR
jgi:hypothetical protein